MTSSRPLPLLLALLALGCARAPAPHPWSDPAARGEEVEIYRTWMSYLASKSGKYSANAWRPSPYWSAAEQARWPVYDLAALYLPNDATLEVVSIEREPGLDGEYRIVTNFQSANDQNSMRSRNVRLTVFAQRSDTGWVLGNALPRLTRSWRNPVSWLVQPTNNSQIYSSTGNGR